ncbi:MAG: hypothetical protein J6V50_05510 [Clostridia bacterium]|nr:hypothetical protein [Clostridia bacterium]
MIKLIIGKKGSGKTKKLIDVVNEAAKTSGGNVVCIEQGDALRFSVSTQVRLVDTENYGISGYGEYYAMLCGMAASNHDVTHIFGDATKRIGGGLEGIDVFFQRVSALAEDTGIQFVFTVSCDKSELPEVVFEDAEEI